MPVFVQSPKAVGFGGKFKAVETLNALFFHRTYTMTIVYIVNATWRLASANVQRSKRGSVFHSFQIRRMMPRPSRQSLEAETSEWWYQAETESPRR